MDYRLIVGVLALMGIFWLAYFSYARERDRAERLSELDPRYRGEIADLLDRRAASDARALAAEIGVSDALKQIIREEEGQILRVYRDFTGKPTVGAGHLVLPSDGLSVGDTISQQQMDQFLEQDLEKAAAAVRRILGDTPVSQHEFDALVDLVYNVGPGNVSERKSPGLRDGIKRRDYRKIADNLIYSKAADGRRAGGLVNRSERRRRIFLEGAYDDPR